jgi:transcription elongation GreA/GreB family factor
MSTAAARPIEQLRTVPLTREAWDRCRDEIARLRDEITQMNGQGLEEGVLRLPVATAASRLAVLKDVLDRSELVDDTSCAAIGRRVTLQAGDEEVMPYEIVLPGSGDPSLGWISADSPLGDAVLGAQVGDVVNVDAPGGRWSATVVAVG